MDQTIIWKPHPGPQTEALTRTEFEILYGGARGGGKTDCGLAWLLRHIANPRYRALIIRRNADDLFDWIDRAKRMYQDTGVEIVGKPVEIRFPSGALFRTGHLKDEDAYTKYQGHEYQRMVIEELTQVPGEESYLKLISSCRSTIPEIPAQVFATTNPGGVGHHWVKSRFVDGCEPGKQKIDEATHKTRIFIPAKIVDNPTLVNNDPTYVQFLEGLPPQLRKAWLEGNWDIVAGAVFTEWNREKHVVKPFPIPSGWYKYIAIDWGVNKPFAVGWYAQDFDGRTYLYRELYMNGLTFEQKFHVALTPQRLARVILEITKENKEEYLYCVADPSMWNDPTGGPSIAETMMIEGLKLIAADNDRINGLARFRQALSLAPDGKPWYQVFSTCQDTIRTIPSLLYDVSKVEDVDTDLEDHAYDRDRYYFMSRPMRSIDVKKIKPLTNVQRTRMHQFQNLQNPNDEKLWNEWGAI